ncbi:MAG: arginase family protein [Actinomycetota bacterium]
MATPLVLDLDGSLAGLREASFLPLAEWQEAIRFGCGMGVWRAFEKALAAQMPEDYGTVFLGSGDFHHLSHLLLKRLRYSGPFDMVVFDNHPDNMRFPFGIHCGSWVRHAARLPGIRTIHVLGICSGDVGLAHAWENHLLPLYRGRVRYWTIGVDTGWAQAVGLGKSVRRFDTGDALIEAFTAQQRREDIPVYLSIDKDVLAPEVARTNWDQGELDLEQVGRIIESLAGRLVGSDITGEISIYRYRAAWKRWLSALDDQPAIPEDILAAWQAQQMAVNRRLLAWIEAAYRR